MSEARILSFEDAVRAREPGRTPVLDLDVLRGRQSSLAFADCHAALDRISLTKKLKTREVEYFDNLSVAFPRGRKVAILGHNEGGQRQLQELLTQRLAPNTGNVLINSRISWVIPEARFFETRGSLRENAIFFSHIIDIDARTLMAMFLEAGHLPAKALNEPLKNLPSWVPKRLGLVILYYCDFDVHLISRFNPKSMHLSSDETREVLGLVYGRDYIVACDGTKSIPENCNLLYLLYGGVLYQFDDVGQGVDVFEMLPKPVDGPGAQKDQDDDGEDDDELREEIIF